MSTRRGGGAFAASAETARSTLTTEARLILMNETRICSMKKIAIASILLAVLLSGCAQRITRIEPVQSSEGDMTGANGQKYETVTVLDWRWPTASEFGKWGLWLGSSAFEMGTNAKGNALTPTTNALVPNPVTGTTTYTAPKK